MDDSMVDVVVGAVAKKQWWNGMLGGWLLWTLSDGKCRGAWEKKKSIPYNLGVCCHCASFVLRCPNGWLKWHFRGNLWAQCCTSCTLSANRSVRTSRYIALWAT